MVHKVLVYITVPLLIACAVGWALSSHELGKVKGKSLTGKTLPPKTSALLTVKGGRAEVISKKDTRVVSLPKFGEFEVRVTEAGEVIVASTGWMPHAGVRPYLGIGYTGKLEPIVGCQVLRIEPLQTGIGVDASPSVVGLSLSKDVLQNGLVGIGTGISVEDMRQKYYVHFSLSF